MRIWIDLANSPHVPFFRALAKEFQERGHEIEVTARDFAETVELARAAGFIPEVISGHGGRKLASKAGNMVRRAWALRRWAHSRAFDLAVSHNSYSQILAARALTLRSVTLMDYEHQPANHLAFRFAARIIVPRVFPETALTRYGAHGTKVKRYNGTKEDVYLADFKPDPSFEDELRGLGIRRDEVLVVVRPPARDALYHRFENELFDELLERLSLNPLAKVILLPRNDSQRATYGERANAKMILPAHPLDGPNLIASCDLVISAGGTMNREAAALGVPAATIYAGDWAAVDEELVRDGRLRRISTHEDLESLPIEKKSPAQPRRAVDVRKEVTDLILEGFLEPAKRGESIKPGA
jgi:predicted glycosyltransferase